MENRFYNDSIFYIEVEKIKPNPFQPRHEFDEAKLKELADSIRQYGVLQPIVVTRREFEKDDGGIGVEYELVSGERRLRASKLAGLVQIPAVIRSAEDSDRMKLELAIIENLQREDLSPIERALAFKKLHEEFGFKHSEIAKKVGKSREFVSNTIRMLMLPDVIQQALAKGDIGEGHTRPLLMLIDRPEEQMTLFKEITTKKMTVREAEAIARRIAYDKVRKKDLAIDPEIIEIEERLTEVLGTRVQIDRREEGGKVVIDYFSNEDLRNILEAIKNSRTPLNKAVSGDEPKSVDSAPASAAAPMAASPQAPESAEQTTESEPAPRAASNMDQASASAAEADTPALSEAARAALKATEQTLVDTTTPASAPALQDTPAPNAPAGQGAAKTDGDDLYSVRNFSV